MTTRTRWLTGLAAVLGYGLLWLGWVQHWSWLDWFDNALLDAAHRYGMAHHGWVRGWNLLCDVFHPGIFELVGVVAGAVELARRHWRRSVFLLVGVALAGVVTEISKDIARRPRPLTALVHEPSWSFPSGHALGTMAGALGLCAVLLPLLGLTWRRVVAVSAVVVVLLVGAGRVILNVHNPSDVLAGWLLGYTWFLVCLPILGSRVTSAPPEPASDDARNQLNPDGGTTVES
ncbi:phosphatase PAP2 family protein [Mycobacterium sp. OTB74]|uniref:phosphatase PAP2 family protein n=1 Tax=Mycobacterium sp. OTB74 TaxID=1853452 RepID=UPI002475F212|nr:phosphatase PAP2 family protein [Mycobacterium sp. OTB74]MDH6243287.1 membrane-associated phospholipid phosphatase [Mycobacterium sp. OTB74]